MKLDWIQASVIFFQVEVHNVGWIFVSHEKGNGNVS